MNDIAIKFENVSKFYKLYNTPKERLKEALHPRGKKYHKEFYALNKINLEIKKGEILGIVGRNGSGKSTLLKLVSGVIQPSSGIVNVDGKVSALLELGSGLHPNFTGIQNIYFSGTMMGFSREEMEEKIDEIVAFADIGDFINQPLKTYSSGMKARLGFALAVNMEPKILVLDEVLAVGDDLFRRKCFSKMNEFFNSGCSVLFVSHSMGAMNEICSRAIFLDKGEQLLEGPTKFVTMHYQKFLYTKPGTVSKVRNEIIRLNKDEKKKIEFAEDIDKVEKKEKKKIEAVVEKKPESKQEAYHLSNLVSKTRVVQKNEDIDVYDICIQTLEGKKVNCLVVKEEYYFTYKIKFNTDIDNLSIGWVLKDEKGLRISGSRYPGKRGAIERQIKKNDVYHVKWKFKCAVLQGTYYIDLGIVKEADGKRNMLVSSLDAMNFKVQRPQYNDEDIYNWAICNLEQELESLELQRQ
jgi:lipopolysaccharide transport system ATP-binding protein